MDYNFEVRYLPLHGINDVKLIYRRTKKLNDLSQQFKLLALENMSVDLSDSDALLLESYYTATIEGARTTLEKVKAGRDKKDEKMVRNCNTAIEAISDIHLDFDNMITMWRMITSGVCENVSAQGTMFRNKMVYIGNEEEVIHTPMSVHGIRTAMESLFMYYKSAPKEEQVIKSIIMHFYIEYIHPMCDGNGRLGRLVTLWSLHESGFKFMRYMPVSKMISQNLKQYYDVFIECEKRILMNDMVRIDLTSFIEFMLEIFIKSIEEMKIRMSSNLTELEKLILTKMSEHGINSEFSVPKCASVLGIPKYLACVELDTLTELGYLEKVNSTYRLKILI